MEVYIRHVDYGLIFFLPVSGEMCRSREGERVRLWAVGRARLDVGTAGLGRPLRSGEWEVHVRMHSGAHQARTRVAGHRGAHSAASASSPSGRASSSSPAGRSSAS